MALRQFRCGSSNTLYQSHDHREVQQDTEAARLVTRIHLPRSLSIASPFRVVAHLADGSTALVCLGATRTEALSQARALRAKLPFSAVALSLQKWVGRVAFGGWQALPCRRGELPPLRRPRLCPRRGE